MDAAIRENDEKVKEIMKENADKSGVKEKNIQIGDFVSIHQKHRKKHPKPYRVV